MEVRGKYAKFLTTPKVRELARRHFGCSSLAGVELEDVGGKATVGKHWDKRMMYSDFMGPDIDMSDLVYSDITMAVFEDSGWYKVNYEYTTDLLWGFDEGCDFITE